MPQQGAPGYLKYRVLDPNTGAVVIGDLFHLRQSVWTIRAPQGGMPGSSTIGDFIIKLPPPQSEAGKANQAAYSLLAAGQKVEGYLGNVITGSPRFSGVITKINKPLAQPWEVIGADTLWWLQQSQLFIGENLGYSSANTGTVLVTAFLGTRELIWDDDSTFWGTSSHPNLSDYTATGPWLTGSDPTYNLPAISIVPTSTTAVLRTNTTWPIGGQYNADFNVCPTGACSIKIQGVVQPGTTAVGQGTEFGVVALNPVGAQQLLLGRAWVHQTALAPFYIWAIDAEIWTADASGAYTSRASVNVFTFNGEGNSAPSIPLEVEMTLNTEERLVRVMVNGQDSNCIWGIDKTILAASGGIGFRCTTSAGGSPHVWFNRLRFESRTSFANGGWGSPGDRFVAGSIATGQQMAPAVILGSQQSHLDMMLMAAAYDGFQIRKNPGAGHRADSIDYVASPGTDLSKSIVFEEGVNIREQGTMLAPLSDLFSHSTRVNAIPGAGGSGGQITSAPLAAVGSMVLTDSVSDLGLANYQLLASYARLVAQRKANVMRAIQVESIRTADTADKWRELDFVTIHIPTLGVFRQRAQVVGYVFTEGEASQTLFLNEYPDRQLIQHNLGRLSRALEFVGTTYARR